MFDHSNGFTVINYLIMNGLGLNLEIAPQSFSSNDDTL